MLQPQILLLREGTDTSQGRGQIVTNINATSAVVEILKTTLGPRGMDKMIQTPNKGHIVTNDGATVIALLDVVHPAARLLCDTAQAQDMEVGDGTTSVILISGEILKEAKCFIEEGMNPQVIIKGFK
jgi:T-complex protein 1 subunit eta